MKITDIKLCTIKPGDTGVRDAAMAKPYDMPLIPHGANVYNYHFVMANTNSPYAEYLSVGNGTDIQPIFAVLEGEPLPVNGKVTLDPDKPGFGVELKTRIARTVQRLK